MYEDDHSNKTVYYVISNILLRWTKLKCLHCILSLVGFRNIKGQGACAQEHHSQRDHSTTFPAFASQANIQVVNALSVILRTHFGVFVSPVFTRSNSVIVKLLRISVSCEF